MVFALTAALYGEISLEKGRVKQRNFHDYRLLRANEMPTVETHILPSNEKMAGVGERGVPSVAPAVANAIFAATGKRLRRLPIQATDLKRASRRRSQSSRVSRRGVLVTHPRSCRTLLVLSAALAAGATLSVRPDAAAVAETVEKDEAGASAAFRGAYKGLE